MQPSSWQTALQLTCLVNDSCFISPCGWSPCISIQLCNAFQSVSMGSWGQEMEPRTAPRGQCCPRPRQAGRPPLKTGEQGSLGCGRPRPEPLTKKNYRHAITHSSARGLKIVVKNITQNLPIYHLRGNRKYTDWLLPPPPPPPRFLAQSSYPCDLCDKRVSCSNGMTLGDSWAGVVSRKTEP